MKRRVSSKEIKAIIKMKDCCKLPQLVCFGKEIWNGRKMAEPPRCPSIWLGAFPRRGRENMKCYWKSANIRREAAPGTPLT